MPETRQGYWLVPGLGRAKGESKARQAVLTMIKMPLCVNAGLSAGSGHKKMPMCSHGWPSCRSKTRALVRPVHDGSKWARRYSSEKNYHEAQDSLGSESMARASSMFRDVLFPLR